MPSSVLGESFPRLALYTDEPVKKLEVIYLFIYLLSRHSYHKTFGLVRPCKWWRKKKKPEDAWLVLKVNTNVGQFDTYIFYSHHDK